MCGIIDDAFSFVKDSIGEVFRHPGEAFGAALGIPGYDPFFGGLFNSDHALLSPTGNFTSSAWNDMYNANPNDTGALNLFHSVNDVADKVAPAIAGYYAGPALAGAAGEGAGAAGGATFTTGLESGANTLGGLESSLGGAGLFGAGAGTGTAIGSAAAQGLGAGGLGIAGGSSLAGIGEAGTALGGLGTSLGSGASLPAASTTGSTPLGGGALSAEGGQATAGTTMPGQGLGPTSFEGTGAGGGEQGGGNLSALYGTAPDTGGTISAGSPTGQVLGQSTGGISPALTSTSTATGGGMDADALQGLFKLGNSLYGAYQNNQQQNAANNYANSIKDIFSPTGAYAQQMQQTLARQDAAAGRNSQYGTRATQLAAALAQAQAQALGNSNYAGAAQNRSSSNFLNTLFSNFGNPQGFRQLQGAYNVAAPYVQQGFSSLANLFG